jgi:hypothetical protein
MDTQKDFDTIQKTKTYKPHSVRSVEITILPYIFKTLVHYDYRSNTN